MFREMSLENILFEKVIESIKGIHSKKQTADLESVILSTKDLDPEVVRTALQELCENNIIYDSKRDGLTSYRFCKHNKESNRIVVA